MAHVRQKGRFRPARGLGLFAGLFQLFLIADGFGDVQGKTDHIAALAALVDQLDIGVVPQPDHRGFGRRRLPPALHHGAPFRGVLGADVDDPLLGQKLQQAGIGDARPHLLQPFEHGQIGVVGRDHAVIQIEEGKAVLNRLDRVPEATFRDLDLLMGRAQVGFDTPVLILDRLDLRAGFVNFVRKGLGMAAQLAVGGEELGLLEFQQTFRGQPGTAFIGQFVGKAHACPFKGPCNGGSASRQLRAAR